MYQKYKLALSRATYPLGIFAHLIQVGAESSQSKPKGVFSFSRGEKKRLPTDHTPKISLFLIFCVILPSFPSP